MNKITLIGVLLILAPVMVLAEDDEDGRSGRVIWGLDGGMVHQFAAGFPDAEGNFSTNRFFFEPSVTHAWDSRNTLSLSLSYGETDYDFSSEVTVDGLSPWGRIRDYRLAVPIRFSPTERSDVIIRPSVRSNSAAGASPSDGRTEGLIAGVAWRVSESLSVGPGLGWYTKLGGGSNTFPVLLIDWRITSRLSLNTGQGLAASQGPGLALSFRLDEKWKLGLIGRIEKTRFALDSARAVRERFGQDKSLPLLFSLQYEPWPKTSVSAFFGGEFEGQLAYKDDDGQTIAAEDYDVALLVGLAFRSRF